jgi:enoyl-CoA hydratase/carnithine racemase
VLANANYGVNVVLVDMLLAMNKCTKPIVAMVRGGAVGIGFTMLAHTSFLYVSPDAFFKTPFMESGQSPEGTSTYLFPKIFGPRLANELLLTDKVLTSQEAVRSGFANGQISTLDANSDWFDPNLIPVIPKLLKNDFKTLTNCMAEINYSRANARIEDITRREAQALVDTWSDPAFIKNMMEYMKQTAKKSKNKKQQAKL